MIRGKYFSNNVIFYSARSQPSKGSQGRRCRVSVLQRVITDNGHQGTPECTAERASARARAALDGFFMRTRNERRFAYSTASSSSATAIAVTAATAASILCVFPGACMHCRYMPCCCCSCCRCSCHHCCFVTRDELESDSPQS